MTDYKAEMDYIRSKIHVCGARRQVFEASWAWEEPTEIEEYRLARQTLIDEIEMWYTREAGNDPEWSYNGEAPVWNELDNHIRWEYWYDEGEWLA